jgi:predicted TIM-barrel fold metal-dependent hydrolase
MLDYFKRDAQDAAFYEAHLAGRLPANLIDAHMHINLPGHVAAISAETIRGDWAMECGIVMTYEDACAYHQTLFPRQSVRFLGLPMPIREADLAANNAYLADLKQQHPPFSHVSDHVQPQTGNRALPQASDSVHTPFVNPVQALMAIRPEWPAEEVEQVLLEGGFAGFKPYPYMAAAEKGAEVSIFDFLPHEHLALAERHHKVVLLHLPRRGRLADPLNIREIREIVQTYPSLKLVLAHFGRSFNPIYLQRGLDQLGSDLPALYFDTAAVLNPQVHQMALERLSIRQILFGTDLPIMLWHGRRRWTETEYINLCRENFSWNRHLEPEAEAGYTLFVYEQIKAMLDTLAATTDPQQAIQAVFHDNAAAVYGM